MIFKDRARIIEIEYEQIDLYQNKEYHSSLLAYYLIDLENKFIVLTNRKNYYEFNKPEWSYHIKEK